MIKLLLYISQPISYVQLFNFFLGADVPCQSLLLSFLLVGKVDLATIVIDIYGSLFLIVWGGVFGRKEIVGSLKTVSILGLISSYYFFKPYWTGSQCGETNPFLQFWIYLMHVILYLIRTPIYTLYILGCLFFYINKSWSLIKTKNKKQKKLSLTKGTNKLPKAQIKKRERHRMPQYV